MPRHDEGGRHRALDANARLLSDDAQRLNKAKTQKSADLLPK